MKAPVCDRNNNKEGTDEIQKVCTLFISGLSIGALQNLVAMVIEALNPRGFPNDWLKHNFNPLQGAMFITLECPDEE